MSTDYDVIIAGSGLGGLTCGAFLSRAGLKVLVLEQHYQIGGYAHGFKRRQYRFESGIHSVALGANGLIMHLLKLLGIENSIEPVPHTSMFTSMTPDGTWRMPVERDEIISALSILFPAEQESLGKLFADMQRFYDRLLSPVFEYETLYREQDRDFLAPYFNHSFADYLSGFINDPGLKNIFYSQWPFVGSSPEYSPVTFFLLMYYVHVREGSHYIKGGFKSLVDALASVITGKGGYIKIRSRIVNVNVENDRVTSVGTETGETYSARMYVSNISPYLLHSSIIDEPARNRIWLRRLSSLKPSFSALAIYAGLRRPLPFDDGTLLWYVGNDMEPVFTNACRTPDIEPDHLIFLKAPPECKENTAIIMRLVSPEIPGRWKEEKKRYADAMLDKAEAVCPGLRDSIDIMEIGSPSTFERYTANTGGALYGFENTKNIYGEAKLPHRTYLKNLYQVGHWGKPGGGVWNVMQNGYTGAVLILKEM